MMLPILISVSVAPVSYFFCASAPLLDAASTMSAAEAMASLLLATGISGSPWMVGLRHALLLMKNSCDAGGIEYHLPAAIKKKPLRQDRRGCFFCSRPARSDHRPGGSAAHLGADDVAKQMPGLTLQLFQLELLDRGKIGGAGRDRDARQQAVKLQALDACRLLHDVGTRQIVSALLQHIHHVLRDGIAIEHEDIGSVGFGIVFVEEGIEGLHPGIVLPLRIGRILDIGRRDDVLRGVESGWLDGGADRARDAVQKVKRLPSDLGVLLDRLRGKLRNRKVDEYIGAARLQPDDVADS